jgi:hypothetical protein
MNTGEILASGVLAGVAGYFVKSGFAAYDDYKTHKIRPFNNDGDLRTPDHAVYKCPSTGTISVIRINKSVYFTRIAKRGFYCTWIERDSHGRLTGRDKKYSFPEMRKLRESMTQMPRLLDEVEVAQANQCGASELIPYSPELCVSEEVGVILTSEQHERIMNVVDQLSPVEDEQDKSII